jgi:hypothetical protein
MVKVTVLFDSFYQHTPYLHRHTCLPSSGPEDGEEHITYIQRAGEVGVHGHLGLLSKWRRAVLLQPNKSH